MRSDIILYKIIGTFMTESLKQSAMLGTSRKVLQESDSPIPLQPYFKIIVEKQLDPEDTFLQALATTLLYSKSGKQAQHITTPNPVSSNAETQPYISKAAIALLQSVLETEDTYFLELWLTKTKQSAHIITPEWIPALLELTESKHMLMQEVLACSGERGKWLSNFNNTWKPDAESSENNRWAHGTSEERKKELLRIRLSNPEEGLNLLQDVWKEENASTRLFLLQVIEQTLTASDEEWLVSIQKDKSQKIKDKSFELQSRLPDSTLVKLYSATLKEILILKKGKSLLGLLNTAHVEVAELKNANPLLWESGIEKLSNIKGIDDSVFLVMQLLERTPPAMLEAHYTFTPKELLSLLQNDSTGKNLIESISHATAQFKDTRWAEQILQQFPDDFQEELIAILPDSLRTQYLIKHIKSNPAVIVKAAQEYVSEWTPELSSHLFTFTSKNPYNYSKTFYAACIKYLPAQTASILPAIKVEESIEHLWFNHRSLLMNRLQLKKDIQETIF